MSEESLKKGKDHCSAGFKLFGVQIGGEGGDDRGGVSAIRKSKSLGNLQACRLESMASASVPEGYLSDGLVHPASRSNERKKSKPWSIEEHRSFLAGLNRLGKGDWKGISTNFVPTRNPTQVASHAQKYFIRKAAEKRRRRISVFDIPLNNNDQHDGGSSRPDQHVGGSSRPVSSWYEPTKRFNYNVRNIDEHKRGQSRWSARKQSLDLFIESLLPTTTTIPVSERPPLSPRRRGISELHSIPYMPRVSAFSPTLSWVPVVNFRSSTNGVHVPNFQEPFPKFRRFMPENAATQPGPPLSLAVDDPAAHTKDDLNYTIRKMSLG